MKNKSILKKSVIQCILFALVFFSFSVFASDSVKVNYTGSIKAAACSIETNNLNVELGTWLLTGNGNNFSAGSTTDWVEFELVFNCKMQSSQVVGSLQGAPASDKNLFKLDDIANAASGMAIQIEAYSPERNHWEAKNANELSVLLSSKEVANGINKLKLRARYKQLENTATPGKANASITFVVQSN
ncbi:fimbrial protein [Proteus sp. G2669]|uniref:fimbrial protein n=1 Tax=Proteus sp. G2669 TaxID=2698881 RepID=UPI001411F4C4|nr:fimbrial protein [Proteus sp. G2669]